MFFFVGRDLPHGFVLKKKIFFLYLLQGFSSRSSGNSNSFSNGSCGHETGHKISEQLYSSGKASVIISLFVGKCTFVFSASQGPKIKQVNFWIPMTN